MSKKKSLIAATLIGSIGAITAATAVKAAKIKYNPGDTEKIGDVKVNEERYIKNLSDAIKYKTISNRNPDLVDWDEFGRFHDFLKERYPLVFSKLNVEVVERASLLIYWEGSDTSLDPIALLGHQDVVPVAKETEGDWTYPPFDGVIADGYLWGRGSLDMKNHTIAVLETIETLLEENYKPVRGIYLCLGHNEEIVQTEGSGAVAMAKLLEERGVHLDCIIDEGGARLPFDVPHIVKMNLAGVGVAEKGAADIKISVTSKGGHSSQAPVHSAVGDLANVIKDLENHQFKSDISPMMESILGKIISCTSYPVRFAGCNIKYIMPVVKKVLEQITSMASMIRTTTAVTQAFGSPQSNVLPQEASIVVNFRIMPGQTIDDVIAHIHKVVRNKKIKVEIINYKNPSKWSPTETRAFKVIDEIGRSMNKLNVTVPYLVMGGTDSCRYENVCENIYRYSPFLVDVELIKHTHGTNEKIPVDTLKDGLIFFKEYVTRLSSN